MKKLILLLPILILQSMAAQNSDTPTYRLSVPSFSISENKVMVVNGYKTFIGRVVYDDKLYEGQIMAKGDTINFGYRKSMLLSDKRMRKLKFADEDGRVYEYNRGDDITLGRMLLNVMGIQAYDRLVYLPDAKPNRTTLVLVEGKRKTKYIDNVFRRDVGDIASFLRRSKLEGEKRDFLEKWLQDNI